MKRDILRSGGLLVLLLSCAACGGGTPPPVQEPEPCDFKEVVEQVWSERVQGELDLPVKILDGKMEAVDAEKVTKQLNAFAAKWLEMREGFCRAYLDNENVQQAQYHAQIACLDAALDAMGQYVELLREGDNIAVETIDALPANLDGCADSLEPEQKDIRGNPFAGQ